VAESRAASSVSMRCGPWCGAWLRSRRPSGAPLGVVASEPLVARLAAHAVARTELGHGVVATLVIGDELQALVHGCSLQPGHPTPRERAALELECHPSSRKNLLPINPVCTCAPHNESLHSTSAIECGCFAVSSCHVCLRVNSAVDRNAASVRSGGYRSLDVSHRG